MHVTWTPEDAPPLASPWWESYRYRATCEDIVQESKGQEIEEQITAAMEEFWVQERSAQGNRTARGESLEAVRPHIQEYAHYYYQVIFQEMAKGEPKLLRQRFRSLVRGCEAVYREHMHHSGTGE